MSNKPNLKKVEEKPQPKVHKITVEITHVPPGVLSMAIPKKGFILANVTFERARDGRRLLYLYIESNKPKKEVEEVTNQFVFQGYEIETPSEPLIVTPSGGNPHVN